MKHILKCSSCGLYTMKEACNCGGKTKSLKPLKYSSSDRLEDYRRRAKLEEYKRRGLI